MGRRGLLKIEARYTSIRHGFEGEDIVSALTAGPEGSRIAYIYPILVCELTCLCFEVMLTWYDRYICHTEGGGDENAAAGGEGGEETKEACLGTTAR